MRVFGKMAFVLSLLIAGCSSAGPGLKIEEKKTAGLELKTEEEKTVYALGLSIAQNLGTFALTPAEIEQVSAGLRDGLINKPQVDVGQYLPQVKQLARQRAMAAAEIEKKESAAFLEKIGSEPGAEKTASGMIFIPVTAGSGSAPKASDTVRVHYKGTLRDGSVFDSSVDRGQPATFPLNRVIPCWTEGVQKMQVGSKARLACPSNLAYGDRGAPPKIRPGSALHFEIELLGVEEPAAKPAGTPPNHP